MYQKKLPITIEWFLKIVSIYKEDVLATNLRDFPFY